ncbi:FG-GAP-like repeat-containing protein, partial [bacterium]|nr:FG-GAP-like repeat-containing protein [bacterium]
MVYSNVADQGGGGGIAFMDKAHDVELTHSLIGLDARGNAMGTKAPNGEGGGLYFNDSTPYIGGPVKLNQDSAVNYIQYNQAANGGGVAAQNESAARILGNWIAHNQAVTYGGGFLSDNASIQVGPGNPAPYPVSDFFAGGNFIEQNSARYGGGAAVINQSEAKIRWNIIKQNALTGDGPESGGIYVEKANAKPQITNNDFILNQGDGLGVYQNSVPTIENNIFDNISGYGVHAPGLDTLSSGGTIGSNCFFNNGLGANSPATNNLNQDFDVAWANFQKDPQFINRAGMDYRLSLTSPCLAALSPKGSLHIGALPGNAPKFERSSDKLANLVDADFGDIDGDGFIDVAAVSNSIDLVILNTGGGVFSTSKTIYIPSGGSKVSHAIELGDFDHDGNLDAVVANEVSDILAINQGQSFKANRNIFDPPVASYNVKLGDLNDDGNLDAIFARDGHNPIFFGDGAGSFTTPGYEIGGEFSNTRDIAVGDLDADGDLDLYFANHGQDEVWLNDGEGIFNAGPDPEASASADKITIGDLDLDGDLDLFVIAFEGNQILL